MFQKNLEAIKVKNPQLAQKLEKIDINSITGLEVIEAESKDLIISYKNVMLHSPIDPVREAKTTWNRTITKELKKTDIQIVFGLGLGYLFKRAYVNSDSKIFLLEPYIEVIRFVLQHVDFSKELADERVYITDNLSDLYSRLLKEYLSGDRIEFLFLNTFAQANQELLQNLTSKACEIIQDRGNDENTIFNLSKFWTENFIKNIVHLSEARPFGFFEGKFADKTALIVSAGPSLINDIEKIKANQDKFVIIAVGKVLRTLANAGIIPDFAVFADARFCESQTRGLDNILEKTNIILLSKADSYISTLKSKAKLVYLLKNDVLAKLFEGTSSKDPGFYNSGSSVSIISYYIAKALGFAQIVFSGLDLAFIDNLIYANGLNIENAGRFNAIQSNIVSVKDRAGNDLTSRADYALFIRQFEDILAEEISLSSTINTSLKGALIKGMEYIELDEVIKTLSKTKPDIDAIVSSIYTETKEDWASSLSSVYSKLKQAQEELEEISKESLILGEEFNRICLEFKNNGKVDYSAEAYEALNNKAVEIRQKIVSNVFTSNSMQKEIWYYTKNYSTKPLPGAGEIIKNIEIDRDLFNQAHTESTNIIALLKETLTTLESEPKVLSNK